MRVFNGFELKLIENDLKSLGLKEIKRVSDKTFDFYIAVFKYKDDLYSACRTVEHRTTEMSWEYLAKELKEAVIWERKGVDDYLYPPSKNTLLSEPREVLRFKYFIKSQLMEFARIKKCKFAPIIYERTYDGKKLKEMIKSGLSTMEVFELIKKRGGRGE